MRKAWAFSLDNQLSQSHRIPETKWYKVSSFLPRVLTLRFQSTSVSAALDFACETVCLKKKESQNAKNCESSFCFYIFIYVFAAFCVHPLSHLQCHWHLYFHKVCFWQCHWLGRKCKTTEAVSASATNKRTKAPLHARMRQTNNCAHCCSSGHTRFSAAMNSVRAFAFQRGCKDKKQRLILRLVRLAEHC